MPYPDHTHIPSNQTDPAAMPTIANHLPRSPARLFVCPKPTTPTQIPIICGVNSEAATKSFMTAWEPSTVLVRLAPIASNNATGPLHAPSTNPPIAALLQGGRKLGPAYWRRCCGIDHAQPPVARWVAAKPQDRFPATTRSPSNERRTTGICSCEHPRAHIAS